MLVSAMGEELEYSRRAHEDHRSISETKLFNVAASLRSKESHIHSYHQSLDLHSCPLIAQADGLTPHHVVDPYPRSITPKC